MLNEETMEYSGIFPPDLKINKKNPICPSRTGTWNASTWLQNLSTYTLAHYRTLLHLCTFFLWRCDQTRARASSFLRFLDHTQRRTAIGRTPLDEWSARCRDLYLTRHNNHNRQTSMAPVGFEPTISAGGRLQTYALDRAATGTGHLCTISSEIWKL